MKAKCNLDGKNNHGRRRVGMILFFPGGIHVSTT
jgi:hypothetical protein